MFNDLSSWLLGQDPFATVLGDLIDMGFGIAIFDIVDPCPCGTHYEITTFTCHAYQCLCGEHTRVAIFVSKQTIGGPFTGW